MVDIGVVEVLVSVAVIILVLSDSNFAGGGGGRNICRNTDVKSESMAIRK